MKNNFQLPISTRSYLAIYQSQSTSYVRPWFSLYFLQVSLIMKYIKHTETIEDSKETYYAPTSQSQQVLHSTIVYQLVSSLSSEKQPLVRLLCSLPIHIFTYTHVRKQYRVEGAANYRLWTKFNHPGLFCMAPDLEEFLYFQTVDKKISIYATATLCGCKA